MPTSNTKPDAPTDVILRDDVVTGQTTPSQGVLTPSTIQRDTYYLRIHVTQTV